MIENVMLKPNLHAKKISLGEGLNAFPKNGCVTEIQIVSTVPMRILHYIIVQHPNPALTTNSHARMVVVLIRDGLVIMTMTVETDPTKESSVTRNTKHAHLKNSLVKTLNVSEINIDAVRISTLI